METMPWLWFAFSAVLGILFWAFLLWLAWLLVSSIRGIHVELTKIREILGESRPGESAV